MSFDDGPFARRQAAKHSARDHLVRVFEEGGPSVGQARDDSSHAMIAEERQQTAPRARRQGARNGSLEFVEELLREAGDDLRGPERAAPFGLQKRIRDGQRAVVELLGGAFMLHFPPCAGPRIRLPQGVRQPPEADQPGRDRPMRVCQCVMPSLKRRQVVGDVVQELLAEGASVLDEERVALRIGVDARSQGGPSGEFPKRREGLGRRDARHDRPAARCWGV